MKFLSNITSGGSAKTTTCVVVRADDPAETVNDTFGYTYGILETLDRENTDAALSHIEDGMGQVKTASFGTLTQLADALLPPSQQEALTPSVLAARGQDGATQGAGFMGFNQRMLEAMRLLGQQMATG